jgi:WD domain, G-beta repeat
MTTLQDPTKRDDDVQGPSWQNELTFRDWKAGLEAARANWAGAPTSLKTSLLLRGADLTAATSWMISRSRDLTPQQQSFIRKSIARSYNSAAEEHRQQDAERKKRLKSWISFGATVSAFVLFLGLELALYDLWVKATGAVYVTTAPSRPSPSPSQPAPEAPRVSDPGGAVPSDAISPELTQLPPAEEPPVRTAQTSPARPTPARQVSAGQLAEIALNEANRGDAVRARLIALEALADANLKGPVEPGLAPAIKALQLVQRTNRPLAVAPAGLGISRATISRDGKAALMIAANQSASWTSLSDAAGAPALSPGDINSRQTLLVVDETHHTVSGGDGELRYWPAGASRPVAVLHGHEAGITALAMSGDGRKVATASWDETVRIWDAGSGRNQLILRGHEGPVLAAAFSGDGTRLVTAAEDRTARIWSAADGRPLAVLRGHLSTVQTAVFDPAGHRVLTTSLDGTAALWDAISGEQTAVLRTPSGPVYSAAFGASARRVVTLSSRSELTVWRVVDGQAEAAYPSQSYPVRSYVLGGDDDQLFVLTTDGMGTLREANTGVILGLFQASTGDQILSAGFSPEGARIDAITARREKLSWPIHRSLDALVTSAREMSPRCLSTAERLELQLEAELPRWCADHAKPAN